MALSRGFRASLLALALAVGAGWLYLRGRADAGVDAGEAVQIRMVQDALAGHDGTARREAAHQAAIDSAAAREAQAVLQAKGERVRRLAATRRADSLLALGDTAAAVPTLLEALETAHAEIGSLALAHASCAEGATVAVGAWQACRARRDTLETLLASTVRLLERRRSFRLLFFTLPRPPKTLAALTGCALGSWLDGADRIRGCGLAATATTVVLPTK